MATKNVVYNEYKIAKTFTVTAYLTIKAVSERHAEDIAEEFDYDCGWDSVSFSTGENHITSFDLDVELFDEGCAEKYEDKIDTTEEDSEGFNDDADILFDVYGEDSDFDYENIEAEEETEEETETETDTETETETDTEEEPILFTEEPPKDEVKPKVQLNFLAKSDNITWDLTVQGLIDRLKELPPNATITMHMYCTELAMGDVVAYVK